VLFRSVVDWVQMGKGVSTLATTGEMLRSKANDKSLPPEVRASMLATANAARSAGLNYPMMLMLRQKMISGEITPKEMDYMKRMGLGMSDMVKDIQNRYPGLISTQTLKNLNDPLLAMNEMGSEQNVSYARRLTAQYSGKQVNNQADLNTNPLNDTGSSQEYGAESMSIFGSIKKAITGGGSDAATVKMADGLAQNVKFLRDITTLLSKPLTVVIDGAPDASVTDGGTPGRNPQ
jgi:hypothetical protein